MRLLMLTPKLSGFQVRLGSDILVTPVISGMPRRRRLQDTADARAMVNFQVDAKHYDYLMAFWRLTRGTGRASKGGFGCRLVIDSTQMAWYKCQWIGVPTIVNLGGGNFSFACEISAEKKAVDVTPYPAANFKVLALKIASHPYPAGVDDYEDSFGIYAKPLDVKQDLMVFNETVATHVTAAPLNISMESILKRARISEGYAAKVKVLDVVMQNSQKTYRFNDAPFIMSARPLDVVMDDATDTARITDSLSVSAQINDVVMRKAYWQSDNKAPFAISANILDVLLYDASIHYPHPDKDAYSVSAKILDVTLI